METAWVIVRERWKTVPSPLNQARVTKVHVGREYIRWAKCPVHNRVSNDFVGVGDAMWLFICTPNRRYLKNHHTFAAQPPLYDLITPVAPSNDHQSA